MKCFICTALIILVTGFSVVQAQNIGIGTSNPQKYVHVIDSFHHTNVLFEAYDAVANKDVSMELKESSVGSTNWLRLKKYSFLSPEVLAGVSLTNAGTLFTGFDAGDLKIGALNNYGQVDFFAGGQKKMRLGYNGYLGIGTVGNAITPLHIYSVSDFELLRVQGPNAAQTFYNNNNYVGYVQAYQNIMSVASSGSNRLGLFTNFNERLTVLPNGNVGISHSNPAFGLDINGTVNLQSTPYLQGSPGALGQTLTSSATGPAFWAYPTNRMYNYAQSVQATGSVYTGYQQVSGLTATFNCPGNCKVLVVTDINFNVSPGTSGLDHFNFEFGVYEGSNYLGSGNGSAFCNSICFEPHFNFSKIISFPAGSHTLQVWGGCTNTAFTTTVLSSSSFSVVVIEQ
jgi:hypothetical protein